MAKTAAISPYVLSACNWEVTLKCTLNCMHCGSSAGKSRQNELGIDECFRVADELAALGCTKLTMIGGEVFLFKGWETLSEYLSQKGISVNIVTNGYTIGKNEIEQIKRARLVNVGVSIDGMEKNHNRIRGKPDAFQRVQKSIDRLVSENIMVVATTSLMNFNCDDLNDLHTFLADHGVQAWQLQLVNVMGNMAECNDYVVSRQQVRDVVEFIREMNRERKMMVVAADSIGYYDDNEAYIRGNESPICCWGGCTAGLSGVFIDSVGNVKGCGALYADEFIEGNVRETPLAQIWNSGSSFSYNRKFKPAMLSGSCKGCEVGDVCRGGCRSSNYFSSKSLYSNSFCCR